MSFYKNLGLFIVVIALSYFLAPYFGDFYAKYVSVGSSWFDLRGLIGQMSAYVFLFPLFFELFSPRQKYWWYGVLFLPVAFFDLITSVAAIYYPLLLILVGFGLGYGLRKLKELIIKK